MLGAWFFLLKKVAIAGYIGEIQIGINIIFLNIIITIILTVYKCNQLVKRV